jgi:hypothetical protein
MITLLYASAVEGQIAARTRGRFREAMDNFGVLDERPCRDHRPEKRVEVRVAQMDLEAQ